MCSFDDNNILRIILDGRTDEWIDEMRIKFSCVVLMCVIVKWVSLCMYAHLFFYPFISVFVDSTVILSIYLCASS